jgi:hypothetical protein
MPSDPDCGQSFWSWHGMCGSVFWSGKKDWFSTGDDLLRFSMTPSERRCTENVKASCCIPLKATSVRAVISFDCLTEEGIGSLRAFYDKVNQNDPEFLDELKLLSLYFT